MRAFFDKYGGDYEPSLAVEMMCEALYAIKEKVERGDSNIRQDFSILSGMIDDFLQDSQGVEFKPKKHKSYNHAQNYGREHHGSPEKYDPYQTTDRLGYNYFPIYPLFERGGYPDPNFYPRNAGGQDGSQGRGQSGGQSGRGNR